MEAGRDAWAARGASGTPARHAAATGRRKRSPLVRRLAAALLGLAAASSAAGGPPADWPYTEGAAGGGRYSPLRGIHRGNVARLQVAWIYRHGDYREGRFPYRINRGTAFEATPLVLEGRLVFTTPYNRVVALDPETGAELWTYDPKIHLSRFYANMIINRGGAYWRDAAAEGACSRRVFLATLDARPIALDAATGKRRWHFQTVHHDISDYDLAAPPVLVQISRDGQPIDAVAQATKTGFVFLLDRDSGRPLFPVEERPVPASDVPGERTWPTSRS